MKSIIILIFLTIISGCATNIVKYAESKPVPEKDRGPAYEKYSRSKDKSGIVIVVRDTGVIGSAGESDLFVNGELVAGIGTKESVKLYLEAGEHLLGVGPGASFSIEETKKYMEEQALTVQAGKTYYYRISIVMGKGMILQRTSQIQ